MEDKLKVYLAMDYALKCSTIVSEQIGLLLKAVSEDQPTTQTRRDLHDAVLDMRLATADVDAFVRLMEAAK